MRPYLTKLLISFVMSALCMFAYADGDLYNVTGKVSAWNQAAWDKYIGSYNIQANLHVNTLGHTLLTVSGYELCHGVFMLQKEVDGKRKDLIFDSLADAQAFETNLSLAVLDLNGLTPDKVSYEVYTAYYLVVAVGYLVKDEIKDGAGNVTTTMNRIKVHYLKNRWDDNSKNYACKDGPKI